MNKTALVVIASGDKYRQYAHHLLASARNFFVPHDVVMFSDRPSDFAHITRFTIPALSYPQATLLRYHMFAAASAHLRKYDYVFYSDADMLFVNKVEEADIFSDGITATEHPGYVGLAGTPETNLASTAYCPSVRTYFCGGFNGGTSSAFLAMSEELRTATDIDTKNGVRAIWNDESHLNRHLYQNPPARILTPEFCYPQSEFLRAGRYTQIWRNAGRTKIVPRLIAIDKEP